MKTLRHIAVTFFLALSSYAQDDPIRVETNLVTLNVSVTDRRGNFVRGLTRQDFTVRDNGVTKEVDSFSAQDAPVSFGIIYDLHPTTDERTVSVLDGLKRFTAALGPSDDFFVSVFNDKGSLTTEFVPTEGQVRTQVESGPNSLYDAIFAASAKIAGSRNNKRVLLVLTDGADHSSHHSLKELKLHLRSVNLPVYAITFGESNPRQYGYSDIFRDGPRQTFRVGEATEIDRGVISEISKTTGGQTFEAGVRNRVYLAALFSKVSDEVKGQYVLGFYPEQLDGKYHRLRVSVANQKQKRLKISNRKGYQSPGRTKARG